VSDILGTILGVVQLEMLYEQKKRELKASVLGADAELMNFGYVDTTDGAVLTTQQALSWARKKHKRDVAKKFAAEKRAGEAAEKARRHHAESHEFQEAVWKRRTASFGVSVPI